MSETMKVKARDLKEGDTILWDGKILTISEKLFLWGGGKSRLAFKQWSVGLVLPDDFVVSLQVNWHDKIKELLGPSDTFSVRPNGALNVILHSVLGSIDITSRVEPQVLYNMVKAYRESI